MTEKDLLEPRELFNVLVEWPNGHNEKLKVRPEDIRMTKGKRGYVMARGNVAYPADICSMQPAQEDG